LRRLIVPTLFAITLPACHGDIAWDMKSHSKSVHAIEMFNSRTVMLEIPTAVQTTMCKRINYGG
jgi:hypothetical protein